jgi:predicted nucleotidyltransferase
LEIEFVPIPFAEPDEAALTPLTTPSPEGFSVTRAPGGASSRSPVYGEQQGEGQRQQPPRRQHMDRSRAIELLRQSKEILARRYGVTRLALFGSTARGAAREDSDLDVLVAFDGPATSQRYFGVQFYLEDLFGHRVDLVTEKALRPELRPFIEREAIPV